MKVFLALLGLLSSLVPTVPAAGAEPVAASRTDSTPCLTAEPSSVLLDVKANTQQQRLPLKLWLLGFSRTGRIALLERREAEEMEGFLWNLRVIELDTDRVLVERSMVTKISTTTALCKGYGTAVRQILSTHRVEPTPLPALTSFPLDFAGDTVVMDLRHRPKDDAGVTRHEVWLKSKQGIKRLGRLQEFDVDSGQPPVGPPVTLGVLQSPWEPRIAVLFRQNQTDTEAAIVPLIRVFGARLDSRWRRAE